ncbi:SMP-30/gluconolactonase/LRE family protein [Anatilimnocola floriformis]|uniref:SMP-30/gluconolactonase/LRE family protein n=1 Tax=Anatilimnocola floriformis TaxID=2948575 RepID=UPI0020C50602|nr:SMP-30/gluconolactonase/LRE family protein [Anatilimnocola floriformis]
MRTTIALLCLFAAWSMASAEEEPIFASKPELLQEKGAGEGPVWHKELGLLTSGDNHIYRRDRDGKVSVHLQDAGSNGLLFKKDGSLVFCDAERRRVCLIDGSQKMSVLTDKYNGQRYNQPNDLTVDSKGRIYFSDPCYGDRSKMEMTDAAGKKVEGVYRIDPDGKVTRVIGREVNRPNGLTITADEKTLFVADNNNDEVGGARKLWRFDLQADGGVDLKSQKLVHDWGKTRGPDGMKLDAKDRLFVAAGLNKPNPPAEIQDKPTAGVYVFSPDGKLLDFAPIPRDETTNVAFGGDDGKTLFVTAGGSLWSIKVNTPGK